MYLHTMEILTPEVGVVAALLLAIAVGAYRSYRQNGELTIVNLPWGLIRRTVLTIRRMYFSHSKPDDVERINISKQQFVSMLVADYFEDNWYLSYHYKGEDANLRKPNGKTKLGNRQRHIRVWAVDSSTCEFEAHDEMSPLQHPKLHLQGKNKRDSVRDVIERYELEG